MENFAENKKKFYLYSLFTIILYLIGEYIIFQKIKNPNLIIFTNTIFLVFIFFLLHIFINKIMKMNYEIINRKKYELDSIKEISNAIINILQVEELLKLIIKIGLSIMNAEKGSIMLLDEENQELVLKVAVGIPEHLIGKVRQKAGEGIAGWVLKNKSALLIKDINEDDRFKTKAQDKQGKKYKNNSLISAPLIIKNKVIGVININDKKDNTPFSQEDLELLITLANQAAISIETAKLYENAKEYIISVVEVASKALEAKDEYTYGHSERVTKYAVDIATRMKLSPEEIDQVRKAGLLHDIGKIGIRESVLLKPGRLTDEEFAEIKKHPTIGYNIIKSMDIEESIKQAVLHHHERYDGRGYPDGLKGEEISLLSRILCVADAFDAMSSNRPYRKSLPSEIVWGELKKNAGTQFDPEVVKVFLEILEEEGYCNEEQYQKFMEKEKG